MIGFLRSRRTAVAAALASTILVSGCDFDGAYDLPLPGSPVDEDNSFTVTAEFRDVLSVVPRSPVMVDDVTVGEVTEVDRVDWHARVTMRVRDDVELPENTIAVIRQTSLLGEKYVALEPDPQAEPIGSLGDGDEIPLDATSRNPEVEEVLGALSFLLSGGGVSQLGTITQELNKVMSGRTGRLRALLGSLDRVVGTLDDQKADIIRAMESLNNLAATLNEGKDTIAASLDVMGPAIKVLSDQHQELVRMLKALDRLGIVGTRVIGAARDDLLSQVRSLEPVLRRLNEAGDSLPNGLSLMLSFPFPDAAQDIVKGDFANTEIRFDINFESFLPDGVVIDPGEILTDVQRCLRSGSLTSPACKKVLGNLDLLSGLRDECKKSANKDNPVCKAINALPGSDSGLPLPDLPGLSGLPGLRLALTETWGTTMTTELMGAGLT